MSSTVVTSSVADTNLFLADDLSIIIDGLGGVNNLVLSFIPMKNLILKHTHIFTNFVIFFLLLIFFLY